MDENDAVHDAVIADGIIENRIAHAHVVGQGRSEGNDSTGDGDGIAAGAYQSEVPRPHRAVNNRGRARRRGWRCGGRGSGRRRVGGCRAVRRRTGRTVGRRDGDGGRGRGCRCGGFVGAGVPVRAGRPRVVFKIKDEGRISIPGKVGPPFPGVDVCHAEMEVVVGLVCEQNLG